MDSVDDNDKLAVVLRLIAKAHIKWNIHKYHLMVSELF
ncbi:unnamed protein product [Anisakis simplex]|uniref:GLOBIN domain-containing protein n=1 Tax=Anisakis simplex TaxID=6269 RepID=A0A0M3K328_ANISI|nr:unnamed protein product [Anisakis simplex]